MKLNHIDKNQRRSFGGWGMYMDFIEVVDDSGEVVAMVCEELGTIWTPQCLEVLHDENNQAIRCELLDYNEDYLVVKASGDWGVHAFPIADKDELAEAVMMRCPAFSMKVICQRANVSYGGFRQWKRNNMKMSAKTLASILCQMDWA